MKNKEIISRLHRIALGDPIDEFNDQLAQLKRKYVEAGEEVQAKQLWIFETILDIHQTYRNAFQLIKSQSYYEGWCQLERVEIAISSLKRHFIFDKTEYALWHVEKSVTNLQVIFPYKMFASSELLKKKKKCSVCDKEVSIRNSCGHIVGEIYKGEMCHRIVTECEVLGIALVENPGNKFSVMFIKDDKTGEQVDHYNYSVVNYLFELIDSPYEYWNLEISQKVRTEEIYKNVRRNDLCLCNSKKKFKNCCGNKIGERYPHYEFKLLRPPANRDIPTQVWR
jgi:hypothetical protein